jgi:hypothetical protein
MNIEALVAHVTRDLDGNRIPLPKHLSDRLAWLSGSETISAWLWTISPGRYRLLSDEQAQVDPKLEFLRSLILNEESIPPFDATSAKSPEDAALVAMLIPIQIKPSKLYWRISFPSELDEFIPPGCEKNKFSILLSPERHLEIWYTTILRNALFSEEYFRS